jgi:hypothetical protein
MEGGQFVPNMGVSKYIFQAIVIVF